MIVVGEMTAVVAEEMVEAIKFFLSRLINLLVKILAFSGRAVAPISTAKSGIFIQILDMSTSSNSSLNSVSHVE